MQSSLLVEDGCLCDVLGPATACTSLMPRFVRPQRRGDASSAHQNNVVGKAQANVAFTTISEVAASLSSFSTATCNIRVLISQIRAASSLEQSATKLIKEARVAPQKLRLEPGMRVL